MNHSQPIVVLQFHDMHMLWQFAQVLSCKNLEINTQDKILTCNCSEAEIALATSRYSAKILKGSFANTARV